jgi:hypothetical protein
VENTKRGKNYEREEPGERQALRRQTNRRKIGEGKTSRGEEGKFGEGN